MSVREFIPFPRACWIALACALAGLGDGCSLLQGGNSPRTAVRILEGGAVSDRHYAGVAPGRIEEAARSFPREQLGLSTQCGFASVVDGNPVDEDTQERKLRLVAEVAHTAWG